MDIMDVMGAVDVVNIMEDVDGGPYEQSCRCEHACGQDWALGAQTATKRRRPISSPFLLSSCVEKEISNSSLDFHSGSRLAVPYRYTTGMTDHPSANRCVTLNFGCGSFSILSGGGEEKRTATAQPRRWQTTDSAPTD